MDFPQIHIYIFQDFSNEVVLYSYVLCYEMKSQIPCNVQGAPTVTKHSYFLFFVPKLLQ